jgi:serine protease Do
MKKQKKIKRVSTISVLVMLCLTLFLTFPGQSPARENDNIALLEQSGKAFASVVKRAAPAVVHIRVERTVKRDLSQSLDPRHLFNNPFFERFFGPGFKMPGQEEKPRTFRWEAAGSGFIISKDGYILTNNHVIKDADTITVRLADEREFKAEVIGTDPQSDVALLKIDGKNLPTIPLGDSDRIDVGEWAIAIGSPFALQQTVTVGVISAKGRTRVGIVDYENFIQTDAAINPGNSGGPLLNIHGEAIGVNTAIFTRSGGFMGISFAIPINMARAIVYQLQEYGEVTRGWLGIGIQDIDKHLAESFGLDSSKGVLVTGVADDSPAEKGGLKSGDVILSIDGKQTTGVAGLRNIVAMITPGSKSSLKIIRDGKEKKINLTVGEQPGDSVFGAEEIMDKSILTEMGLTLQDLTPSLAEQFGYKKNQGVLIADVRRDSPAARVGIRPGALLEEVNRVRVSNLKELNKVLENLDNQNQVLVRIRVGEHSRFVVMRNE